MGDRMIFLNRSLIDLAAAYQQIDDFNNTLKETWLPGFIRSYERRQAAYSNSIQRYENRHWIWRLLFKSPKAPSRLPIDIYKTTTQKLWGDWIESLIIQNEEEELTQDCKQQFRALCNCENDQYFVLFRIHYRDKDSKRTIVASTSDSWFVCSNVDDELVLMPLEEPIHGLETASFAKQLEIVEGGISDKLAVFCKIDVLLSYHQNFVHEEKVSALEEANRLILREKDNLLKLAATL